MRNCSFAFCLESVFCFSRNPMPNTAQHIGWPPAPVNCGSLAVIFLGILVHGFGTHAFHGGSLRLPKNPTNKTKRSNSFFNSTVVPTLTFWLFFSWVLLGQQKRFVHFAKMRFLFLKCRIQMIRQEKTSSWFIMLCHVLREFLV